jgi:hypothetical protein
LQVSYNYSFNFLLVLLCKGEGSQTVINKASLQTVANFTNSSVIFTNHLKLINDEK